MIAARTLPGFEEYSLLDQTRVHVERYAKTGQKRWAFAEYDEEDGTVRFEAISQLRIFQYRPSAGAQYAALHPCQSEGSEDAAWFFYYFSNYGSYERLTEDGLTQWHPAFLALGKTMEACTAVYKRFCERYRPKPTAERKRYWGQQAFRKP